MPGQSSNAASIKLTELWPLTPFAFYIPLFAA
jgi:hypothetical protein